MFQWCLLLYYNKNKYFQGVWGGGAGHYKRSSVKSTRPEIINVNS